MENLFYGKKFFLKWNLGFLISLTSVIFTAISRGFAMVLKYFRTFKFLQDPIYHHVKLLSFQQLLFITSLFIQTRTLLPFC